MPRRCSVCTHPKREAIDQWIASGSLSYAGITRSVSGLTQDAVEAHAKNHIPALVKKAAEAHLVAHGEKLADQIRAVLGMIQADLEKCGNDVELKAKLYPRFEGLLRLLGLSTRQLEANGGGVTIVNQVAVGVAEKAETLTDEQIADRCLQGVERWNAANPGRLKLPRVMQVEETDETTVAKANA